MYFHIDPIWVGLARHGRFIDFSVFPIALAERYEAVSTSPNSGNSPNTSDRTSRRVHLVAPPDYSSGLILLGFFRGDHAYAAAKRSALRRLRRGYDLGLRQPGTRDVLNDREGLC